MRKMGQRINQIRNTKAQVVSPESLLQGQAFTHYSLHSDHNKILINLFNFIMKNNLTLTNQ